MMAITLPRQPTTRPLSNLWVSHPHSLAWQRRQNRSVQSITSPLLGMWMWMKTTTMKAMMPSQLPRNPNAGALAMHLPTAFRMPLHQLSRSLDSWNMLTMLSYHRNLQSVHSPSFPVYEAEVAFPPGS